MPEVLVYATGYKHSFPFLDASYPRSGNTFTRLLIERATGWHTSSLYCDRELARAFDGECARRKTDFLVKCVVDVLDDLTAQNALALSQSRRTWRRLAIGADLRAWPS